MGAMKPTPAESSTMLPGESLVPLESILCTDELNRRPSRLPDYEKENRALVALAQALADSPSTILQKMTEIMLEAFRADSSGFSVLTKDDGEKRFYWAAISGEWKPYIGGGAPRDFSPCGDVLDRNTPLLFRHPERRYPYFLPMTPLVEEWLLAPFHIDGKVVGMIWVIAHDDRREFDAEDMRQLVRLGKFASSAYQTLAFHEKTLAMNEALMLGSLRQHELTGIADSLNVKLQVEITERKRSESSLRVSEERFRALFDLGPVAIYSCDTSGVIQDFNRRAVELWGREPAMGDTSERFCGSFKMFRPDGSFMARELCPMVQLLSGEIPEVRDAEVIIEQPGGSRIIVIVNIRPLKNERGEITGAINCFYDISERKQAEKLLQMEKRKADAANQAKSEFLANMSHEIRTPMNAVLGLSYLLAMSKDIPKKQQEMISTLQLSAQSLLGLINDLLDIAKIETNSIDLESIPFTLNEVISEVFNILSLKAQEKSIALDHVNSLLNTQKFLGDPLRIRQVLMNLISNALKFTEQGGVTISVTTSPHEESEYLYVHIAVCDTGIGIAPNKLAGIFEKFTQGDTSITRKYGGTGLGLAISKNLAEIMGGSITIKSDLGKGSEFTLHLPLELADEASADTAIAEGNQKETPEFQTLRGCILLAEDYKPNVMVATYMLESLGYSCDIAINGKEALEKIRTNKGKYLAVLMDVQMPGMDGFEATKIIREEEKAKGLPHLPIIAMTAHALHGDRESCLKSGMDDYISKPFEPRELANKLAAATASLEAIPQLCA